MSKQNPVVKTQYGRIAGKWISEKEGNVAVFKGIPYASPPIGTLRWRPPQPMRPWHDTLEAFEYGDIAMQRTAELELFLNGIMEGQGFGWLKTKMLKAFINRAPKPTQSEDCLTLNVRTVDLDGRLPVMVWIHGGAHQNGSSRDVFYDSNTLAFHNVVLVSINYRLGLMGYYAHPELSDESEDGVSGNYGTLDQIAALQWVKENIEVFGGDPNNITIFGESAGGESVLHMMCSPKARGLFHKAIAQSPATSAQLLYLKKDFHVHEAAETSGQRFMALTGAEDIRDLRALPAEKLMEIVNNNVGELGLFHPVVDGVVLPDTPFGTFCEGKQAQVPFIVGSNGDESTLFYDMMQEPLPEYERRRQENGRFPQYMQDEFGEDLEKLFDIYPGLEQLDKTAVVAHQGDVVFGAPARFYAGHSARQGQPTYLYLFKRKPDNPNQTLGAFHAADLPFVHGTSNPVVPLNEKDQALSQLMRTYWTNFAKTGDPNSSPNLPTWQQFDSSAPHWMAFDVDQSQSQPVEREPQYQIFIRRLCHLLSLEDETLPTEFAN